MGSNLAGGSVGGSACTPLSNAYAKSSIEFIGSGGKKPRTVDKEESTVALQQAATA